MACARRAAELGLSGLTFTEHFDTHPDEIAHSRYDDEKYTRAIGELRERWEGALWIGKGIEVDYQPASMPAVVDFLAEHGFDLVLLAVHYCDGEPVFDQRIWQGNDPESVTRRYLETVLHALEMCERWRRGQEPVFDVLAHLDFIKRYSLQFTGAEHLQRQGKLLDQILRACLRAGVTPELNASTLRKGHPEGMPGIQVIKRYAELGGAMMCLGSDSHSVEDVGAGLPRAAELLRRAGITQTAVFERRVRRAEPL
jgi:histidinol-phosphatase (PHP family)